MPGAARKGDQHTCGKCNGSTGSISQMAQNSVFVNSKIGSVKGDGISGCSGSPHTRGHSNDVFYEGKGAHRLKDDNTCSGKCISASSDVFVN